MRLIYFTNFICKKYTEFHDVKLDTLLITDSENAASNCDKRSSKSIVPNETSAIPGFTSLEYSFNGDDKEPNDKPGEVVRRDGRKSIAFQRHSVHQINLSKKVKNSLVILFPFLFHFLTKTCFLCISLSYNIFLGHRF